MRRVKLKDVKLAELALDMEERFHKPMLDTIDKLKDKELNDQQKAKYESLLENSSFMESVIYFMKESSIDIVAVSATINNFVDAMDKSVLDKEGNMPTKLMKMQAKQFDEAYDILKIMGSTFEQNGKYGKVVKLANAIDADLNDVTLKAIN